MFERAAELCLPFLFGPGFRVTSPGSVRHCIVNATQLMHHTDLCPQSQPLSPLNPGVQEVPGPSVAHVSPYGAGGWELVGAFFSFPLWDIQAWDRASLGRCQVRGCGHTVFPSLCTPWLPNSPFPSLLLPWGFCLPIKCLYIHI